MIPSLAETSALIRSRRTVKPADMETDRPVEHALLMELLENANWAPTHGLTEPWRFRAFTGDARARLGGEMQRLYREVTPPAEFREDKFDKLGANPLLAPVIVVAWMERRGGDKIPEIEEIEAVACAMQNLMLSATAAGLGSFWSSPPLIYERAFNDWLGIRAEDRCAGLLYLGWPKDGASSGLKSVRTSIHDKISFADA
ncbi:MAG: nitroreductase [Verrucomicrobiaceae bacterium]|nr:nitroreductase [Verrucomicrobiaceae bacterium]